MTACVFALPGNEPLAAALAAQTSLQEGALTLSQFPDGETLVRIESDVRGKNAVVVCSLDRPNAKILPLYFVARTLREFGATRVWLVAPYLAYMRQDQQFHSGEAVTANQFADWLSGFLDGIVTVDPHLHRIHSLNEIYAIRSHVVAAAPAISAWIAQNVRSPLLIGPDTESEQWVRDVARGANAPFIVLEKRRLSDTKVDISIPQLPLHSDRSPVLLDDIISTGHTMIAATKRLTELGAPPPVCIGVHGIFAGRAYEELAGAHVAAIATCNTIAHRTNAIDVHPLIAQTLAQLL